MQVGNLTTARGRQCLVSACKRCVPFEVGTGFTQQLFEEARFMGYERISASAFSGDALMQASAFLDREKQEESAANDQGLFRGFLNAPKLCGMLYVWGYIRGTSTLGGALSPHGVEVVGSHGTVDEGEEQEQQDFLPTLVQRASGPQLLTYHLSLGIWACSHMCPSSSPQSCKVIPEAKVEDACVSWHTQDCSPSHCKFPWQEPTIMQIISAFVPPVSSMAARLHGGHREPTMFLFHVSLLRHLPRAGEKAGPLLPFAMLDRLHPPLVLLKVRAF